MAIPSNGITPEVIRGVMPPYHLSRDLLAATIAALPAPPPDSTTAWRQARLTRLLQEIVALKPSDAAQARIAAQLLTTRGLVDAFTARALAPNLEINQMCRLGRTAAELIRSAIALDRALARHQQMPVPFYGTVIQDEVDIPALEAMWASGILPSTSAAAPASTSADAATSAGTASPTRISADAPTPTTAATPPPVAPQPTVPDPLEPPPDPEPTPPNAAAAPGASRPVARSRDTIRKTPGTPPHSPRRRQLGVRTARSRPRLQPRGSASAHRRRPAAKARSMRPTATTQLEPPRHPQDPQPARSAPANPHPNRTAAPPRAWPTAPRPPRSRPGSTIAAQRAAARLAKLHAPVGARRPRDAGAAKPHAPIRRPPEAPAMPSPAEPHKAVAGTCQTGTGKPARHHRAKTPCTNSRPRPQRCQRSKTPCTKSPPCRAPHHHPRHPPAESTGDALTRGRHARPSPGACQPGTGKPARHRRAKTPCTNSRTRPQRCRRSKTPCTNSPPCRAPYHPRQPPNQIRRTQCDAT